MVDIFNEPDSHPFPIQRRADGKYEVFLILEGSFENREVVCDTEEEAKLVADARLYRHVHQHFGLYEEAWQLPAPAAAEATLGAMDIYGLAKTVGFRDLRWLLRRLLGDELREPDESVLPG